ncbi:hypothetical protein [Enterococcus sp.]|uniref:hypothetical protein n=1 Tax=Enterococcus sp. TaxID=35783 RepID=UPI003C770FEF
MGFEGVKIRRARFVWLFPLLFVCLLLLPFISFQRQYQQWQDFELETTQDRLASYQKIVDAGKRKDETEESWQDTLTIYAGMQDQLAGLQTGNYRQYIRGRYQDTKIYEKMLADHRAVGRNLLDVQVELADLAYFKDAPEKYAVTSNNMEARMHASFYLAYLLQSFSLAIPLALLALLISFFTTYEKRNQTENFDQMLPHSSNKRLITKFVSQYGTLVGIMFLSGGIIAAIVGTLTEWGSLNYQIHYADFHFDIHYLTIGELLVKTVLLLALGLLLCWLVSWLIGGATGSLTVHVLVLWVFLLPGIVPHFFAALPTMIAKWLPTSYYDIWSLLRSKNQWFAPEINFQQGVITHLVWIVALVGLVVLQSEWRRRKGSWR